MKKMFDWLLPRSPAIDPRSLRLPGPLALDERPLAQQRLVLVDLETSGLNLQRDHLLAIGAVVIENGAIDLSQQFECTVRQADHQAGASTLIHGIAPSTIAAGRDPAEALLEFMDFVDGSPLLAFHAPFDQHMLERALRESLGYRLRHPFIDVAELAPLLCPEVHLPRAGLDDWLAHFHLLASERHHASADALATAELALILFSKARRQNLDNLAELQRLCLGRRRRQLAPAF
jgi:DNA polymerase-3 subunit epsilon